MLIQPNRTRGFTLIELLVVIAILGLLIALLLPALAMANNSAKAISTLAAMQQTMVAYHSYSVDRKEQLLPGYLPTTLYGKPVAARFMGQTHYHLPAQRYPMRLAGYQGDSWELIYHHKAQDLPSPEDSDFFAKAYELTVSPTFGINATFVGGDHRYRGFAMSGGVNRPNPNGPAVFKMHRVKNPSGLIALAEARSYEGGVLTEDGFHTVTAPKNEGLPQWSASGDSLSFPSAFGGIGIPAGRYVEAAATGFLDGHGAALKPGELQDMRLWSNFAKTEGDPALFAD